MQMTKISSILWGGLDKGLDGTSILFGYLSLKQFLN